MQRINNADLVGKGMCEKCSQIDAMISRYRRLQQRVPDQLFRDRSEKRIAELHAAKAACRSSAGSSGGERPPPGTSHETVQR